MFTICLSYCIFVTITWWIFCFVFRIACSYITLYTILGQLDRRPLRTDLFDLLQQGPVFWRLFAYGTWYCKGPRKPLICPLRTMCKNPRRRSNHLRSIFTFHVYFPLLWSTALPRSVYSLFIAYKNKDININYLFWPHYITSPRGRCFLSLASR